MKATRYKPSPQLAELQATTWLIFAFGLRHILAHLFPFASRNIDTYTELFGSYWYLISDVLVLLVAISYTQQLPETGRFIRFIRQKGRLILGCAFLLDSALSVINHSNILTNPSNHQFNVLSTTLIIDLVILLYLLISRNMKQVFDSLPPPAKDKQLSQGATIKATQPRSNIPNEFLVSQEIIPGYLTSGFPFPFTDTLEPILRVRNHIENNRFAIAEKGLRILLIKDPKNSLYWHELAMIALATNKLEQAEALILKAMLLEANNFTYSRNLGEVRRRLGFIDEAIKYAKIAIKINPEDTTAQYNLGIALWDAGENDQALVIFNNLKLKLNQ